MDDSGLVTAGSGYSKQCTHLLLFYLFGSENSTSQRWLLGELLGYLCQCLRRAVFGSRVDDISGEIGSIGSNLAIVQCSGSAL